jgi:hypothetical protein
MQVIAVTRLLSDTNYISANRRTSSPCKPVTEPSLLQANSVLVELEGSTPLINFIYFYFI